MADKYLQQRFTNRFSSLSFLKGIGCIGVVLIHFRFPGLFGTVVWRLSQFAVPIFMMTAGYFAYGRNAKTIRRRLIKIVKILVFSLLLYFLYSLLIQIKRGNLVYWLVWVISVKAIIKFFLFCTVEYAIFLWYLIAMAEVYLLWLAVQKRDSLRMLLRELMPLMFLGRIALGVAAAYYNLPWFANVNFVTCGLCWFLFGMFVKENEKSMEGQWSGKRFALVLVTGVFASIIPDVYKTRIDFSSIGIILMSCSLFCWAIEYKSLKLSSCLEFIGDKLSLYVYVFHVIIGKGLQFIVRRMGGLGVYQDWIIPVLTVIGAILLALAVYRINRRIRSRPVCSM